MGLLDILNGMQNGPRGQQQPASQGGGGGGMSPWMMAVLGLLAYKAIKGGGLENMLGGRSGSDSRPTQPPAADAGASRGGIGDILGGLLGGGAQPGAGASGGLGGLLGSVLGGGAQPGAGAPGGLGGMLGGLMGGAATGGALNQGLRNLLGDLQEKGHGEAVKSWVGTGENQPIAKTDLAKAIGAEDIDAVAKHTGMSRDEVLSALSEHLPEVVNQLTPEGRLPSDQEAARWV